MALHYINRMDAWILQAMVSGIPFVLGPQMVIGAFFGETFVEGALGRPRSGVVEVPKTLRVCRFSNGSKDPVKMFCSWGCGPL